jgi:Immunity protein 7
VFEWHGWAVIRGSAGAGDDAEADRVQALRVEALVVTAAGVSNEVVDLRSANGSVHLWIAGDHNHHGPDLLRFYERVAATAPGSYGDIGAASDRSRCAWRWGWRRRSRLRRSVALAGTKSHAQHWMDGLQRCQEAHEQTRTAGLDSSRLG